MDFVRSVFKFDLFRDTSFSSTESRGFLLKNTAFHLISRLKPCGHLLITRNTPILYCHLFQASAKRYLQIVAEVISIRRYWQVNNYLWGIINEIHTVQCSEYMIV